MDPSYLGNDLRQPHAPENGCQVIDPEWLGEISVEFSVLDRLFMLRKSIGRYCNNARVGRLFGLLPDAATGLEAIHFRHVQIHQDDLEIAVAIMVNSIQTIVNYCRALTELLQQTRNNQLIGGIILCHQYV